MMSRCYNTNDKDFPNIGGRGITVCQPWHVFENFERDMGVKPEGSILYRCDDNANFSPETCSWRMLVNAKANPLYSIWKAMRRRCGVIGRADNRATEHYIARGIQVCSEWQDDFHTFAADVGLRPSPEHSLDRIDNNLGYFPGNVRWALPEEQGNNRIDNIVLVVNGTQRTLSQWARHHDVDVATVHARFAKLFDPAEPRKQKVQQLSMNGTLLTEYESAKAAAKHTGISVAALQKCLCGGNASSGGFKWRYGTS